MTFIKTVENFACEKCGIAVEGTGYTNHCPKCLWSKHVDVEPGDRRAKCRGMMAPQSVEGSSPEYRIIHKCERCGIERAVALSGDDDADAVVRLAQRKG